MRLKRLQIQVFSLKACAQVFETFDALMACVLNIEALGTLGVRAVGSVIHEQVLVHSA